MIKRPAPCPPAARCARPAPAGWRALALVLATAGLGLAAGAQPLPANGGLPEAVAAEALRLAREAATVLAGDAARAGRIELRLGRLDPRLVLAPCPQIVPYLPVGSRPLGRTRLGLRCASGSSRWNVSLPLEVKLWAPSLVAASTLPAGTVLEARHLAQAEVDLAERADPALGQAAMVLGRTLARGLAAGEALRRGDLKTRLYFNAGDTVRITAVGPGYAVSSEGQALGPGLEGQSARVRTDSGRIITGIAAGERRVELAL